MTPTPTQRRMLALLADGKPHCRRELHKLLWDEQSSLGAVRRQLCEARKVVRAAGGDIICEIVHRRICYRHVRLLNSP
jgi:hypothetical protein